MSEQLVKILTRPRRSIKQAKRTRTRVRITLGKIEFFFFRNSKSPVQCKRNRSPRRGSTVRVYKLSGSSAVHYRTVLFFGVHPPPPFKYTDMYGRDPAETGGKTPISTRVVIITVVGTRHCQGPGDRGRFVFFFQTAETRFECRFRDRPRAWTANARVYNRSRCRSAGRVTVPRGFRSISSATAAVRGRIVFV